MPSYDELKELQASLVERLTVKERRKIVYDLIQDVEFVQDAAAEYAEPGYTDPPTMIVTGNWNHDVGGCSHPQCERRQQEYQRKLAEAKQKHAKRPPKLQQGYQGVLLSDVDPVVNVMAVEDCLLSLGEALEILGCEIEWLDEWTVCSDCGKLVRTQADSYGWKRSYWDSEENGPICHECVQKDPEEYLESLVGNCSSCITIGGIDLDEQGFRKLDAEFESGWYGGQDADPHKIGAALQKRGIDRFIFELDDVGQFDVSFSVWVDKGQYQTLVESYVDSKTSDADADEQLRLLIESEAHADVDPAEELRLGLQAASAEMAKLPANAGIKVAQIRGSTATAKVVSAEDFIAGKALD